MGSLKYYEALKIFKKAPTKQSHIDLIKKFISEVYALQADERLIAPIRDAGELLEQRLDAIEILLRILKQGPFEFELFKKKKEAEKEKKEEAEGEAEKVTTEIPKEKVEPESKALSTGVLEEEKAPPEKAEEEILDFYQVLEIDPVSFEGKTEKEIQKIIQKGYREQAKKVHPDFIRAKYQQGEISKEEFEIAFKKAEVEFELVDLAYRELLVPEKREEHNEIRKRQAAKATKTAKPTEEAPSPPPPYQPPTTTPPPGMAGGRLAIVITPSTKKADRLSRAYQESLPFINDIKDAGIIDLDENEAATLGLSNLLPTGYSPEQLTSASHLYAKGVRSTDLEKLVDEAVGKYNLNDSESESLYGQAYFVKIFEETNFGGYKRNLTKDIQQTYIPQVSIQEVPIQTVSSENRFVFESGDGGFKPLIQEIAGRGLDKVKAKVKDFAVKAIKQGGKKIAQEAAKRGVGLALKAGIQAASTTIPVAGNIVSFIITDVLPRVARLLGKLVPRFVSKFIKENKKEIAAAGFFLLAVGLLGPSLPLIILGALGLLAAGITLGGIGATASAIIAVTTFVVGFILTTFIGNLLLGTAIFIAITVIFIIFALLIINQSAYLTPYNPIALEPYVTKSAYISVVKTADPDEASNGDLPITVNYRVVISATQGSLTNISFQSTCNVSKDVPPSPGCPIEENIMVNGQPETNFPPPAPSFISPSQNYELTYTQTFPAGEFENSLIVDTFTVTADAPDARGERSSSSATVCIGDCPQNCPSDWPLASGYITQGAYTPSRMSHHTMEAIDIGASGSSVFATHTGIVRVLYDSCEGNQVHIVSTCGNLQFFSEYSHLEAVTVSTGTTVSARDIIGVSGNTGSCTTGPHLHYRFRYSDLSNPSYPNDPPYMWTDYIPSNVPRGCSSTTNCHTNW